MSELDFLNALDKRFSLALWLNDIQSFRSDDFIARFRQYELALIFLPRSYKLWHSYLGEWILLLSKSTIVNHIVEVAFSTFERSLLYMNKMPSIWLMYIKLALTAKRISLSRTIFHRSLQALPITQHSLVWQSISELATLGHREVNESIIRGWVKNEINLGSRNTMVDSSPFYLFVILRLLEQGETLALGSDEFITVCELCSAHAATSSKIIDLERLIRTGLSKYPNETARLWNNLAEFFIRLGLFEKARNTYEEALDSVFSIRDFTLVFDSLIKIEETILSSKMRHVTKLTGKEAVVEQDDINLRLWRLEKTVDYRSLKLNSVLLRENPNVIKLWMRRVQLLDGQPDKQLRTYELARVNIEPTRAVGRFSRLWISWAQDSRRFGSYQNAHDIYKAAVKVNFKFQNELSDVWCAWIEFEIQHKGNSEVLKLLRSIIHGECSELKYERILEDVKLIGLYLDLEESLGTFATTQAAYGLLFEKRAVTVQMVLNYSCYLEEHGYYEESFRNYERGIQIFDFPQVKVVWLLYLEKFMSRYEKSKILRLDDLFEQSLSKCPKQHRIDLYLKYSHLLESHALEKKAVKVLGRAYKDVSFDFQLGVFRLYAKKGQTLFGPAFLRKVYTEALESLNDDQAMNICLDYFALERKLGEIDRARGVLKFAVQFIKANTAPILWKVWKEFEEDFGSEESYKEMLRIQMSAEVSMPQSILSVPTTSESTTLLEKRKRGDESN